MDHTIPGWVRIRTPASTANLGPGFDCLGIALKLYNTFEFSASEENGFEMEITGREMAPVPKDKSNLAYVAFKKVFAAAKMRLPALRIKMGINIPLKRGLGSSATAIIGGMAAANQFLPESFPEDVLLDKIITMEGHPDNVIACYYGGLTATVPAKKGILYRKYKVSQNMRLVLGIPDYEIATEDARNALPERIPLKDAVSNLQRIPLLVDALNRGKLENLDDLMQDSLHQPYRKSLVKGFERICDSARAAGASGVALSGAGPTIAAFCTHEYAHDVATGMSECMDQLSISHQTIILSPDMHGTIIEKRR